MDLLMRRTFSESVVASILQLVMSQYSVARISRLVDMYHGKVSKLLLFEKLCIASVKINLTNFCFGLLKHGSSENFYIW